MRAPHRLAWLLVLATGCLTEYTVGAPLSGECADGEVLCDGACAPAGACDDDDESCPEGQVKCGDACAPADACACDEGCDEDREVCDAGACVCRPGLDRCGSTCVDLRADAAHCGDCTAACEAAAPLCQASACVAACAAPLVACGGACVDTRVDSLHCGECGERCKSDEVCMAGECRDFHALTECAACPCPGGCAALENAACCDSPFVGGPVCVEDGCD